MLTRMRVRPRSNHGDLWRGLIQLHVLHHAPEEDVYGLGLMEELRRHGYSIGPGTLYPLRTDITFQEPIKWRRSDERTLIRTYGAAQVLRRDPVRLPRERPPEERPITRDGVNSRNDSRVARVAEARVAEKRTHRLPLDVLPLTEPEHAKLARVSAMAGEMHMRAATAKAPMLPPAFEFIDIGVNLMSIAAVETALRRELKCSVI